ncbi:MAG TPA: hypothetical protein PLU67_00625 [Candidatus Kapabacteria bacterium]|mgnify:CR=1 FL=1|nr:hypothetical protein [Candidatus Kapabacteria bacterium]HOM03977.1 hypothetical protein [Candidatus Kapabacteria bacterium]HPU23513.1 hypothetical protein [Candidatus Kapabacteria bacterium]
MRKLLFLGFLLILLSTELFPQPLKVQRPKQKELPRYELSFDYQMSNASTYFSSKGNIVSRATDTVPIIKNDSIVGYKKYTFQLSRYYFIPNFKWRATKKLTIDANLSFVYSNYNEKYTYDSNYRQAPKADFNMFQVENLKLTGEYVILDGATALSLVGGVYVPFGFYRGQDDPDYDFLCDGAFELLAGANFRHTIENVNFELGSIYNWRDEDLKPRFILNSKIGIVSVPGTQLLFFGRYFLPLGDNSKLPKFNLRRRPLNEETLQLGAGFNILFDNNVFINTGYNINIAGKNALGNGVFNVMLGYRF